MALQRRLEVVFRREGYSRRKAHDTAFHLLDWLDELDELHRLYRHIQGQSDRHVRDVVTRFLVHAPHHINAAKFLYKLGGPKDVFRLGFFRRSRVSTRWHKRLANRRFSDSAHLIREDRNR